MTCPSSRRLTAASTGEDIAAELHAETCARLPPGIELAYDGQVLEIE